MSANSAAINDESTTNVSPSSSITAKSTSSYANIVLKDNGDKEKLNTTTAVPTNVPSSKNNNNNKKTTDKSNMELIAQESTNANSSSCNTPANDPNQNANTIEGDDGDAFTPVANTRKDRNSRRNKDRGTNTSTGSNNNNSNRSNQSNKSQRQPRSENGRSKDATNKRAKGNNHRDDKEKSIAQSESVATTGKFS